MNDYSSIRKRNMHPTICFISETGQHDRPLLDPSVRYRCYHPSEALLRQGLPCTIRSASSFFENPLYHFDIYVFHRPNVARPGFLRTLAALSELGRRVIADYDDLIFGGEDAALASSAVKNATLTPEKAISAFAANLEAMMLFENVTVSTTKLAEKVAAYNSGAKVTVVPNRIPDSISVPHREYGTAFRKRPGGSLGYFAGTKSHDHDLKIVEEVLHRVLLENPDFTLRVIGPVKLPASITALPNVVFAPPLSYWRLPFAMSYCDTVIAPLEDTEFNACKSRVKFLEAALSGCRLVASPIPDMAEIGTAYMELPVSKDDWYEALSEIEGEEAARSRVERNLNFLEMNKGLDSATILGDFQ